MRIILVIPTIRRYDLLRLCLNSFYMGSRIPNETWIIDNGSKSWILASMISASEQRDRNIHIYTPPWNLGVSGSVNFAMNLCAFKGSLWLHCNDDVEAEAGMLRMMEIKMGELDLSKSLPIVVPDHGAGSMFTCFMADSKVMLDEVGPFDERFFPAYFEDNDYAYRMILTGLCYRNYAEGAIYSHKCSSTLATYTKEEMEEHHKNFARLAEYYTKKWGGPPDHETFKIPFQVVDHEV